MSRSRSFPAFLVFLAGGSRSVGVFRFRFSPLCPSPKVACGFAYTAAVTASGELYTWGAGENGRLGLGDVEDRHTPSRYKQYHIILQQCISRC